VIWYAAAAAVAALVVSVYLLRHPVRETRKDELSPVAAIDIPPGGNKATLTLGGGQVILLDSSANGRLAVQGATTITKRAGGLIAYDVKGAGAAVENTLTTPRGGQYRLTLPDGTKVWVNAASSIIYPTAFTGKERKVRIEGEAFFEVAQNKDQPFIVEVRDGLSVEVLGTGFNVNAYSDEPSVRTTLVSGSVKVRYDRESLLLKPDQQVQLTGARLTLDKQPNMDETLAWRNGYFLFSRTPLDVVMRQLSRWYDIDIVYAGGVPAIRFEGDMKRDLNLSEVLNILRKMEVHCKMEGRRLIVLP
jgi:ferric-dicitrate binding protein FerR (iron transport regulator)